MYGGPERSYWKKPILSIVSFAVIGTINGINQKYGAEEFRIPGQSELNIIWNLSPRRYFLSLGTEDYDLIIASPTFNPARIRKGLTELKEIGPEIILTGRYFPLLAPEFREDLNLSFEGSGRQHDLNVFLESHANTLVFPPRRYKSPRPR